jgi:hypothetical protein
MFYVVKLTLDPNLPQPQILIDICHGLVVHRSDGILQFAHFTVQEYLQSHCSSQLLSNVDIAHTCITYLLLDKFERRLGRTIFLRKGFY